MNKIEVFKDELSLIQSDDIRKFAATAVSFLPDYFFQTAASSTGKYHPKYALEAGGLVRHTRAAVAIADCLLSLEMYNRYTQCEKDMIIAALILHDGMKHGETKSDFTLSEHPNVIATWILEHKELGTMLPTEQIEIITGAIKSHMGQWNTDYKTKKEILPKPTTATQKMVHVCDYLASRKFLEFNFGDSYYNPDDYEAADNLKNAIAKIVEVCKQKIDNGQDKDTIYAIISEVNDGKKNPNAITNIDIANHVLQKLEAAQ